MRYSSARLQRPRDRQPNANAVAKEHVVPLNSRKLDEQMDSLEIVTIEPLQRSAKDKEPARRDQGKADGVIPGDRLLQIENREAGENEERDHLLDGLELCGRIGRAAPTV